MSAFHCHAFDAVSRGEWSSSHTTAPAEKSLLSWISRMNYVAFGIHDTWRSPELISTREVTVQGSLNLRCNRRQWLSLSLTVFTAIFCLHETSFLTPWHGPCVIRARLQLDFLSHPPHFCLSQINENVYSPNTDVLESVKKPNSSGKLLSKK